MGPSGDYWFEQRYDDAMYAQTEGMTFPVRCRCGHVYDLGTVTVTARYADCSMWKTPCCNALADDRKPPWGIAWYTELPRHQCRTGCEHDPGDGHSPLTDSVPQV